MDRFKIQQSLNESLEQSWMRTKSKSFEDYKKSNGFKGQHLKQYCICGQRRKYAYWHGNFIPIRDKN
jgi:hypothetical protein